MIRFVWQFSYQEPPCLKSYLDKRPAIIKNVHFLHFGVLLFLTTCAASWIISILTPPIPDKYVFKTIKDCLFFKNLKKLNIDQRVDLFFKRSPRGTR